MKVYVVTEDGVDGVYAVCLRKDDADKLCEENSWLEVHEETVDTGDEPVFLLRGQDVYAEEAVRAYEDILRRGRAYEQADQVHLAWTEMLHWQDENPSRIKVPDHQHVPAVGGDG